MEPSIAKILSRFNGHIEQAIEYCSFIMREHPRLAEEYRGYRDVLIARAK